MYNYNCSLSMLFNNCKYSLKRTCALLLRNYSMQLSAFSAFSSEYRAVSNYRIYMNMLSAISTHSHIMFSISHNVCIFTLLKFVAFAYSVRTKLKRSIC